MKNSGLDKWGKKIKSEKQIITPKNKPEINFSGKKQDFFFFFFQVNVPLVLNDQLDVGLILIFRFFYFLGFCGGALQICTDSNLQRLTQSEI